MHIEIRSQGKTLSGEIRNGPEATCAGIGNAHAEVAAIAQGDGSVHTDIGRNGNTAQKAHGDISQLNRGRGRERNGAGNCCLTVENSQGRYRSPRPAGKRIVQGQLGKGHRYSNAADGFVQNNILDGLRCPGGLRAVRRLRPIREDISNIHAICGLEIRQVAPHAALCVGTAQNAVKCDLFHGKHRCMPVLADTDRFIAIREPVPIDYKCCSHRHSSGKVHNCDSTVLVDFHRRGLRDFHNAAFVRKGIVMINIDLISGNHCCGILKHSGGLRRGHGLLGQDLAVLQGEPTAVYGHLQVIRIADLGGFGVGIFRSLVQLEAQAEIQRVGRKFAGSRLVRLKCQTGLQIDNAKLHRNQQIAVARGRLLHVAVIVVGIVILLHGHAKGLDQLLHPFDAAHRLFLSHNLRHQQRSYAAQYQYECDEFLFHAISLLFYGVVLCISKCYVLLLFIYKSSFSECANAESNVQNFIRPPSIKAFVIKPTLVYIIIPLETASFKHIPKFLLKKAVGTNLHFIYRHSLNFAQL